jgi:apolipoprotein N-acyltransferase
MIRYPKSLVFGLGTVSALGLAPQGLWPLTIVSFALFLAFVQRASSMRSAAMRGFLFSLGHFLVGLNWIAGAFHFQDSMPEWFGWIAVLIVSLIMAPYAAIPSAAAWHFRRGNGTSFILVFAAAWIVCEWLRATLFTGFAWNPIGVVLIDVPLVRDTARIIGSYGLSAWVTVTAGIIMVWAPRWIQAIRDNRGDGTWPAFAIGGPVVLFVGLVLTAAAINRIDIYRYPDNINRPLVRVVQPNIGQQYKHVEAFAGVNFEKLERLSGKAGKKPRLLLWPEAAIPDYLDETDVEAQIARARIARLLGPDDILLTGGVKRHFKQSRVGPYIEEELVGARNAVFAVDGNGKLLARYDKVHLVPGGEYLPFKPILAALGLSRLVPGTVDFWSGPGPRSLSLPGFGKVGVQICYEIVFSGQLIDRTNRPEFLFNPSNDAWFGAWGPPQHLAQARLRAIEEAMPIIRSTPTGISAVIDTRGGLVESLPHNQPGFIETELPPPVSPSLFARFGNVMPFAFAFFLLVLAVALHIKRRYEFRT